MFKFEVEIHNWNLSLKMKIDAEVWTDVEVEVWSGNLKYKVEAWSWSI